MPSRRKVGGAAPRGGVADRENGVAASDVTGERAGLGRTTMISLSDARGSDKGSTGPSPTAAGYREVEPGGGPGRIGESWYPVLPLTS